MNVTDISSIAENLRHAKKRGRGGTLLIGAGCSESAGIPLASKFVEIIKKKYPNAYRRAVEKTYPECMGALSEAERRSLISEYIDKAKINWAHIAIAQLMKEGYVERVLTTNFDPLISRACALVGLYPAIYDLASSLEFHPHLVYDKAIFHLHGQRTGFVILNTKEQCNKLAKRLKPVIEDSLNGHPCIVVGYSGDNDPVVDKLAKIRTYDGGLAWICYQDSEPSKDVQEKILVKISCTSRLNGFNADDFFVSLAQELKCFPPYIISDPFAHLDETLASVQPYTIPGQDAPVTESVRKLIKIYGDTFRRDNEVKLRARELLFKGKFDEVISLLPEYQKSPNEELAEAISRAFLSQGGVLYSQAQTKTGEEAEKLYKEAREKCTKAVEINPKDSMAYRNWGLTLSREAEIKTGKESERLRREAIEKYATAVEINSKDSIAYRIWAELLSEQAGIKTGKEAEKLFKEALEKCAKSIEIDPSYINAYITWGLVFYNHAGNKTGKEAEKLYKEAGKKYAKIIEISPKESIAYYNWGLALSRSGKLKTGKEAEKLFKDAVEKCVKTIEIDPSHSNAYITWGLALHGQAEIKTGKEAEKLYKEAEEKYAKAAEINPKEFLAYYNWGLGLYRQAEIKTGKEAEKLYKEAGDKYAKGIEINPEDSMAYHNWGITLSKQAEIQSDDKKKAKLTRLAEEKFSKAKEIENEV